MTWNPEETAPRPPVRGSVLLGLARGAILGTVTFGCLGLLLLLRLIERPVFGPRRPVTPWITRFVCRTAFVVLGIRYRVEGRPIAGEGVIVANHSSWLDIFALNACQRVYFVSKAEVRGWPGIGWLARATGTIFIERDRREAGAQVAVFQERLHVGHRLVLFPEGTSTDGRRVLPFKPTLFAALFAAPLRARLRVQPVSVIYEAPRGADPRAYGWWGNMDFGPHLWAVLKARPQGSVTLIFHESLAVSDYADRKALAAAAEAAVREGVMARLTPPAGSP